MGTRFDNIILHNHHIYRYLAICPSAQPLHVSCWIDRHMPSSVSLEDVTSQYCVLALMGPQSRQLLQTLTKSPLDNDSFPFATAQVNEKYLNSHMHTASTLARQNLYTLLQLNT